MPSNLVIVRHHEKQQHAIRCVKRSQPLQHIASSSQEDHQNLVTLSITACVRYLSTNTQIHKISAQQYTTNFCTMIASIDEREKAIPLSKMTSRSRGGITSVSSYNNFIQAYKIPTRCSLQLRHLHLYAPKTTFSTRIEILTRITPAFQQYRC
jgi:hypothetical protein